MSRPMLPRIGRSLRTFHSPRRSLHHMPGLNHDFSAGVPGLLSGAAVDLSWNQYQGLMIEKLNVLTAGTEYDSKPPRDVLMKYAHDANSAPIFNYASMAHNNHYFFNCLSPNPTEMSEELKKDLEGSFGSIETLQREMVITASSMFGPGFVWLMKGRLSAEKKYTILTTYLAGSPFPQAHHRRQTVDMNTESEDSSISDVHRKLARGLPVNTAGSFGASSRAQLPPGGQDMHPILCINTWEHVYLPDYGVGANGSPGKRGYAENWWYAVDWAVVADNARVGDPNAKWHF